MLLLLLILVIIILIFCNKCKFNSPVINDKNILGTKLEICSTDPITGFYRNGYCTTGPEDKGIHSVCATMSKEFMDYTASQGNDLSSVVKPGENWCLCAIRYRDALEANKAPKIIKESTHEVTKNYIKSI